MHRSWLFATAAVLLSACGGDSTTTVSVIPDALTGEWVANSTCSPGCSFTLTSVANPSAHTDVVATSGATIDLLLRADGSAALSLLGQTSTGTASVSGNTLLLASGGTVDTINYVVTSTLLDLQFKTPFPIDINGDGIPDSVTGHAVLRKN